MITSFPLLCVCLSIVYGMNTFNNRYTEPESLVFLYTFEDGQLDTTQTYTASGTPGLGNIELQDPTSWEWMPDSQGLQFFRGNSVVPAGSFRTTASSVNTLSSSSKWTDFVSSSEFTLELWFSLDANTTLPITAPNTIALIGDLPGFTTFANSPGVCNTNRPQFLQVQQCGSGVLNCVNAWSWFDSSSSPGNTVCDKAGSGTTQNAPSRTLVYLAYVIRAGQPIPFDFYVNSSSSLYKRSTVEVGDYVSAPSAWSSGRLHLSHAFENELNWGGIIHMVGLWSSALTESQIQQNYAAGPPNSVPYQPPFAITALQYGQAVIAVNATDRDDDPITYKVYTLPTHGTLSVVAFGVITPAVSGSNIPAPDGWLLYRHDGSKFYGENYTTLSYHACDATGCSAPIVVTVNVAQSNPPPSNHTSSAIAISSTLVVVDLWAFLLLQIGNYF